jgi:hypothetical protein
MYFRKIRIQYAADDKPASPCPLRWLDNFAMRNFTNHPIFDDTLPVQDGVMEIGRRVPLDQLRVAMEGWFHRKSYLKKTEKLAIEEEPAEIRRH